MITPTVNILYEDQKLLFQFGYHLFVHFLFFLIGERGWVTKPLGLE